jgi:hypothetical protein
MRRHQARGSAPRRSWRLVACHRPSHEELPLSRPEDGSLLRRSLAPGRQVLQARAQPHCPMVQRDCGRAGEDSLGADDGSPGRLLQRPTSTIHQDRRHAQARGSLGLARGTLGRARGTLGHQERGLARRGGTEWGRARSELADPIPGISPPRRASPRQGQSSVAGSARQVIRLAG